ncbi:uncharacterized protein TRAVEDRAFT_140093 [Trametes versicolor FP-101664 SS1]|uniref:uncharacterized protein n=1 Tax=Trametes versicolor (strain FP-101664) TaxID=717944 RepID=UPI00046231E6|nr:uncharacterized protein TRAVEDRAFT_140093 [Trametes versicolor FP-101664 SS1]EIW64859.1 hypothetical protein TRAVEDRAFT_140093 [Trametes versicolor FP-101664 SS1]
MAQHLSGFSDSMPWVFLLLGEAMSTDMEADARVVLDLVLPQIGGRGGGSEPFALERAIVYHEKVLAKVADEFERYDLSGKIRIAEEDIRRRGDALVALRHDEYMARVLPLYAEVHHVAVVTLGVTPRLASDEMRDRAEVLAEAVVHRVIGPRQGEADFCRYCGEPGIITRCGVCKTSYFCEPCHRLAWKYHRKWCTPFRER